MNQSAGVASCLSVHEGGFCIRSTRSISRCVHVAQLLLVAAVLDSDAAASGAAAHASAIRTRYCSPTAENAGAKPSSSTIIPTGNLLIEDGALELLSADTAPPLPPPASAAAPPSISLSVSYHGRLYPVPSTFVRKTTSKEEGKPKLRVPRGRPFLPARKRIGKEEKPSADTATSTATVRPSSSALAAVVQPIIPSDEWAKLTGQEFQSSPAAIDALATLGIDMADMEASEKYVDWSASKATASLLNGDDSGSAIADPKEGTVLVWTGKWKESGHGSHLPVVRTVSVLPMSPRSFAALLMDSARVQTYNKMSLGRTDVTTMKSGIDDVDGEAKVVRNLTKPPLSKKKMEFVTVMHARRLREGDGPVGEGYLGGSGTNGDGGYIVVSRAVNDGGDGAKDDIDGGEEFTRSEILLGVNLVRPVPGHPDRAEVTALTHCNTPSVPLMIAGKIGVKGAVDFVRDIRAL